MNIARAFMLIGSLGRIWAVTKNGRRIYQTISIVAYFKLMNGYEGSTSKIEEYKPNNNKSSYKASKTDIRIRHQMSRRKRLVMENNQINLILNSKL